MPRRRSLVTVIREMVQAQVQEAIQGLLGTGSRSRRKQPRGAGVAGGVTDRGGHGGRMLAGEARCQ